MFARLAQHQLTLYNLLRKPNGWMDAMSLAEVRDYTDVSGMGCIGS